MEYHPSRYPSIPKIPSQLSLKGSTKNRLGIGLLLLGLSGCAGSDSTHNTETSTKEGSSSSSQGEDKTTTSSTTQANTSLQMDTESTSTSGTTTGGTTEATVGTMGEFCPPNYCFEGGSKECVIDQDRINCICLEGYKGDQCSMCSEGYQNVGENGELDCKDITPPPIAKILTAGGGNLTVVSPEFDFFGQCEVGSFNTNKIFYRIGKDGDEIEDLNYKGENTWSHQFENLPPNEILEYFVILEDKSGNRSENSIMVKYSA